MKLTDNIDVIEKKSISKIKDQLRYFEKNKSPGLFNGWHSEETDANNKKTVTSCGSFVEWINDPTKNEMPSLAMCCELCLTLRYAGQPMSIRLVFTPKQPWMPPDILIMTNDGFMDVITPDNFSSLERWPEGRDDSIVELIGQIYYLYKEYNLAKLHQMFPDLREQYELFEKELQLKDEDMEVLVLGSDRVMCVQLPLSFEDLPLALFTEHRGPAACVLEFTATEDSGSQYRAYLHMTPRAACLLEGGPDKTFELPSVPPGCKSLVPYTSNVVCLIQDRIKKCMMAFEKRKQVVAQLLCQYEAAVSQYDKEHFCTIELLLQESEYHYLVDVSFPHGFPEDCGPTVTLRSICQEEDEQPQSYKVPHVSHRATSDPEDVMNAVLRAAKTYHTMIKGGRSRT